MTIQLPDSYAKYTEQNLTQIKLSHHPASSPTVTPVILLTLYRPKNNNAFTRTMSDEICTAYTILDRDPRVKAIVMTGHGRMFCAGADLEQGFSKFGSSKPDDDKATGNDMVDALSTCRKLTIAAVNGPAVGVGITFTLPMSIRIAYKDAKVGFLFAKRGLVLEAGSSFYLPRMVGLSNATYLSSTGRILRASDRLLEGIFAETCESPEETVKRALEIAEDAAQNVSTVAAFACREMLLQGNDTVAAAKRMESEVISGLYQGK